MRITFDYSAELDQAYLQVGETRPVTDSVEVEGREDIRLDFDDEGLLVGVAFTEAEERLQMGVFVDEEEDGDFLRD